MEVWAIVVAAGRGERFGAAKQYAELDGKPLVAWSLEAAACCSAAVLVVPAGDVEVAASRWGADAVVAGGDTRSASVRAGLAAVPSAAEGIVVHDAARPLAPASLWRAVIDAVVAGADAAVPVVPVTDTIKQVTAAGSLTTLDRSRLVAVQTPQGFRAAALRAAHAGGTDATDDAALVEVLGGKVVAVPGSPHNLKITGPGDLEVAGALLRSSTPGGSW
ncbi:MAG TPA: 2-C-methyl-D-erythritol 4-phosphate cytidylyltransferase [Acidimicrobiales bacterium]|nr:2-C-methyl-D-erythritol 4-phosphate cytidylyltransferase [Acidimicrobiales bacterium]